MKYSVYAIYDDKTGTLLYVGCTKNRPEARFSNQVYAANSRLALWRQRPTAIARVEQYTLGAYDLSPSEHRIMVFCQYILQIRDLTLSVVARFEDLDQASDLEDAMIRIARPLCNELRHAYKRNYAA